MAEIAKLPGIGRKSALRLALHLLKADASQTQRLTHALNRLKAETRFIAPKPNSLFQIPIDRDQV